MFFNRQFSDHFPGPFDFRAGSDGVDNTFDVYCLTTDQWIIATRYWEERQRAELVARVVTNALNVVALNLNHDSVPAIQFRDLAQFQQAYPGPYSVRRGHCEYYGPRFEIVCDSCHDCVVFAPRDSSAKMVSRQIAQSLNLFSHL